MMDNFSKSIFVKNEDKDNQSLDAVYYSLKEIIERKKKAEMNGEELNLPDGYYELVKKQIKKYDEFNKTSGDYN